MRKNPKNTITTEEEEKYFFEQVDTSFEMYKLLEKLNENRKDSERSNKSS